MLEGSDLCFETLFPHVFEFLKIFLKCMAVILYNSIKHEKCPPSKKFTRAWLQSEIMKPLLFSVLSLPGGHGMMSNVNVCCIPGMYISVHVRLKKILNMLESF